MLYKYSNGADYVLGSLQKSYLWFSTPENFNDPYDSLLNQILHKNISAAFQLEEYYLEKVRNNLGICCFSSTEKNLHLWSHYGNSHRGICIAYDEEEINKYLAEHYLKMSFQKVNYTKSPLNFDGKSIIIPDEYEASGSIEIDLGLIDDPKKLEQLTHSLVLNKDSNTWSNENEYRLILAAGDIQKSIPAGIVEKVNSTGYRLTIKPEFIKQIFIGLNASEELISKIRSVALCQKVPIFKMASCPNSWELTYSQV